MKEAVQEIISASQLEAKTEAKWVQVVGAAHSQVSVGGGGEEGGGIEREASLTCHSQRHQSSFVANRQQADSVKAEVVDYAREKWPMFFSRFFKVSAVSGRHSGQQRSRLETSGLYFMDSC